jgi:hypothetical protein
MHLGDGRPSLLVPVQKQHGQARCMAGDATGKLLVVAGDGAGLSDATDAGRARITVSVWRLPAAAVLDASSSAASPSLLCSFGRAGGRSWLLGGSLTATEPYCGWTLSVSPASRRVAVAQPGGELLLFHVQVRKLQLVQTKKTGRTLCSDCDTVDSRNLERSNDRASLCMTLLLCFCMNFA